MSSEATMKQMVRLAKKRLEAIKSLGGSCEMCNFTPKSIIDYNKFEIHHISANNGEEDNRKYIRNILNGETENYKLLCSNCHIEANILDGTAKGCWTDWIKEELHKELK